jgi:uncharacterized membrane protein YgdD (TMEM256/DUF423 family)
MQQVNQSIIRIAAVLGAIAVGIGAFGAHGLKPHLTPYQLDIFEKGVQYQFYHALALLGIGVMAGQRVAEAKTLNRIGGLFATGCLLFSGSLYLLACRDLLPFPVGWAGPVTPLGGLCFLAGWVWLAVLKVR